MTREITVRDLLTHRTGMGNTDYLWSWMTISGDSALYKMREVKRYYRKEDGSHESPGDHSWTMAMILLALSEEYNLDLD